MLGQPRLRMHQQRGGALQGQAISFVHVQLLGRLPVGQLPVKSMDECRGQQMDHAYPQAHPGADPPACSKGYQLVVVALHIHAGLLAAGQEPLGAEDEGLRPLVRVPGYGPNVHEEGGSSRYVVPVDLAALGGYPREGERGGWVEPEVLLDHGLQVGQPGQVELAHQLIPTDH